MQPPKGNGPFYRGERLTAAKLNEFVAAKPTKVYGDGHIEGDAIIVDSPESQWIRLTSRSVSNVPVKYAWKRVTRANATDWIDLTHTGDVTNDYACEVNNNNVTVGTTAIYKAVRSETTGEWLFYGNGTATPPPNTTCNNGVCASPPSCITITFPQISEFPPYTYPSSFPNWNLTPGYKCYYNLPGDPRDGALRYETVKGWTYHSASIYKKIYEILSSPVTVPTSLGSWLETSIDIATDFADFFPMQGDYRLYEGPTLLPDTTTPQKNYQGNFETILNSAKRFVNVRMTNGGACTMRFEAKQRIVLTLETEFSETTYNFGPFGIPAGSTTQEIGGYWDGASLLSRRNPCGSDGDPDGADKFEYDGATVTKQDVEESQGGTDGYAENIDCGEDSVDYSD